MITRGSQLSCSGHRSRASQRCRSGQPRPTTLSQGASNLGRSILGGLQRRRSSSSRTFPTRARPFKCAFDCVVTGEPAAQI